MSILNRAPEPDKRSEAEKIKISKEILDVLVRRKLIPMYDGFKMDDLFKNLDETQTHQAFSVSNLIEKILKGDGLLETHPTFNLQIILTAKGRDMMKYDSFRLWEQRSTTNSPTPFVLNDFSNNKGTILKDASNVEMATEGGVIDKSIKLNEESKESKELEKKGFHLNKKMLIWTIVGVLLAALIALWPLIKKGLSF